MGSRDEGAEMANDTTQQTITRLGVLTALTYNRLRENHLDEATRKDNRREITAILNGMRDVGPGDIQGGCIKRCVEGIWN
jgi:hypothetical protein